MSGAPIHDFPIRDEILWQWGGNLAGLDVLEVGAGSGYTAWRLASLGAEMYVADYSCETVKELGKLEGVLAFCVDFARPLPKFGRFDFVYSLDMLECVSKGDGITVLWNMAKCLRKGGEALITFPNHAKFPNHYTREELESDLWIVRSGLNLRHYSVEAVELRPWAQFWYTWGHDRPLGLLRRLRKRNGSGGSNRSMDYGATWAFGQRAALTRLRPLIHGYWAVLGGIIKLGGPAFRQRAFEQRIEGRQILVRLFA